MSRIESRRKRNKSDCASRPIFAVASGAMCLALFALSLGCQTLELGKPFEWSREKATQLPSKITAIWSDAVQSQPGQPSQRGFGGRIFFYDETGKTIKVDGTVSIYVFDDDRELSQSQIPEKKFVFPADSLSSRYSKCPLGHSYNFWIGLGPVDGPTRNLSLVTRIDPAGGAALVSSMTRKILPGNTLKAELEKSNPQKPTNSPAKNFDVTQAGFQSDLPTDEASHLNDRQDRPSLEADTIKLTPSFTQRLRMSRAEDSNAITNDSVTDHRDGRREEQSPQPANLTQENSTPGKSPATDSAPRKFPAREPPSSSPIGQLPRHQPHQAGWLSGLPPTPRSGFRNERRTIGQSETRLARQAAEYQLAQEQAAAQASAHEANSADGPAVDD